MALFFHVNPHLTSIIRMTRMIIIMTGRVHSTSFGSLTPMVRAFPKSCAPIKPATASRRWWSPAMRSPTATPWGALCTRFHAGGTGACLRAQAWLHHPPGDSAAATGEPNHRQLASPADACPEESAPSRARGKKYTIFPRTDIPHSKRQCSPFSKGY